MKQRWHGSKTKSSIQQMVKWQTDRILMAGGCPKNYNKHIHVMPFLWIKTLANRVLGEVRPTPTLTTSKDGLEIKK